MSTRDEDLLRIGATIRDRRERALLDRPTVAEKADVSVWTIKDIEAGKSRARRLTYLRIADAIGMSADDMDALTGDSAGAA